MAPYPRTMGTRVSLWLAAALLGLAAPAAAQKAVLTACSGKASGQAAQKIHRQIAKALESKGLDLVAPAAYLKAAKKKKLARRALQPQSVAKLAPDLGLDGVVTCHIQRSKGRYKFTFKILGPDGRTLDDVSLRNKKPVLGRPGIDKVARAAQAALSGKAPVPADDGLSPGDDIALIPLVPLAPADDPAKPKDAGLAAAPPAPDAKADSNPPAEFALVAPKDPVAPEDPVAPKDPVADEQPKNPPPADLAFAKAAGQTPHPAADPEPAGQVVQTAPKKPGEPKSIPEVWVAAGASMHLRAGLNPRYQAGPFPGVRIEGRAFLGSLIDMAIVADLGLEFAYDRGIGLTYESAFRQDSIDAYEQHWRAGLVYRLSFEDVDFGPAVLFRVGYGNTTNGVDQAYPDLVSASYSHLDLSVDAHIWLVRPLLKAYFSAGWIALVTPSESLSGSGMGVTFSGGVALELFDAVHLSAGYEQWQFVFDEDDMGETSDRFQMIFFRAGWTYR